MSDSSQTFQVSAAFFGVMANNASAEEEDPELEIDFNPGTLVKLGQQLQRSGAQHLVGAPDSRRLGEDSFLVENRHRRIGSTQIE